VLALRSKRPAVMRVFCEAVDLVTKNWTQLRSAIFEASEAIVGGRESENSLVLGAIRT